MLQQTIDRLKREGFTERQIEIVQDMLITFGLAAMHALSIQEELLRKIE